MLKQILLNTLLALIWVFLVGDASLAQLAVGYGVGAALLGVVSRARGQPSYVGRVLAALDLIGVFLLDVFKANVNVARRVLEPRISVRPGIVAVPLDARSDLEITTFAGMITLTPGTLALDVSPDRRTLYVHALHVTDPERMRRQWKARLERRILAVTSPLGRRPDR